MIQLDDTHRREDRIPSGLRRRRGGVGDVDLKRKVRGKKWRQLNSIYRLTSSIFAVEKFFWPKS